MGTTQSRPPRFEQERLARNEEVKRRDAEYDGMICDANQVNAQVLDAISSLNIENHQLFEECRDMRVSMENIYARTTKTYWCVKFNERLMYISPDRTDCTDILHRFRGTQDASITEFDPCKKRDICEDFVLYMFCDRDACISLYNRLAAYTSARNQQLARLIKRVRLDNDFRGRPVKSIKAIVHSVNDSDILLYRLPLEELPLVENVKTADCVGLHATFWRSSVQHTCGNYVGDVDMWPAAHKTFKSSKLFEAIHGIHETDEENGKASNEPGTVVTGEVTAVIEAAADDVPVAVVVGVAETD